VNFITYGAGQLVSGYFGDRVQPRTLIGIGLATTSCMNLLIPLCTAPWQMTVVWCLNGFAQAFMWPPIVKMLFCALSREDYSRGCVRVSWGSSLGTMTVYLMAPLLILLLNWKSVFLASAIFGIAGLLIWLKSAPTIDLTPPKEKNSSGSFRPAVLPALILVMVGIILHGILKDGVTTWMPSYLSETFGLRNEISILAGIVLPVFSIICYSLVNFLYLKMKKVLLGTILIFCMASAFCGALYLFYDKSPVLSILLSALITSCMHGVNFMLIGIAPTVFGKDGTVSTYSGILNFSAYIGSAISAYVIPLATENAGWNTTIFLWLCIALAGTLACVLCIRPWKTVEK
jgi:OPA family glycerol-3-phosphate transporter-like MFS transporter